MAATEESSPIREFESSITTSCEERRFQRRGKKLKEAMKEIQKTKMESCEEIRELKTKLQIRFELVEEAFSKTRRVHLNAITKDSIEDQMEDFREKYGIHIEKLTEKLKIFSPLQEELGEPRKPAVVWFPDLRKSLAEEDEKDFNTNSRKSAIVWFPDLGKRLATHDKENQTNQDDHEEDRDDVDAEEDEEDVNSRKPAVVWFPDLGKRLATDDEENQTHQDDHEEDRDDVDAEEGEEDVKTNSRKSKIVWFPDLRKRLATENEETQTHQDDHGEDRDDKNEVDSDEDNKEDVNINFKTEKKEGDCGNAIDNNEDVEGYKQNQDAKTNYTEGTETVLKDEHSPQARNGQFTGSKMPTKSSDREVQNQINFRQQLIKSSSKAAAASTTQGNRISGSNDDKQNVNDTTVNNNNAIERRRCKWQAPSPPADPYLGKIWENLVITRKRALGKLNFVSLRKEKQFPDIWRRRKKSPINTFTGGGVSNYLNRKVRQS